MATFEERLTGGHPNSLGNTVEVVDEVLGDQRKLEELFNCYFSEDEVVRLRTSNAMKRVMKVESEWLVPYLDRLLEDISQIDQASAQWTLAQLFAGLDSYMSDAQLVKAKTVVKRNLETSDDWIVLNASLQTLGDWARRDEALKEWLKPHLGRLSKDSRKSVANRARKIQKLLSRP